jgi:hypothetical protein
MNESELLDCLMQPEPVQNALETGVACICSSVQTLHHG